MNNNNRNNSNNNNNRRRGRSGNRQQGGAQQLNRVDSRARGNAPQMLEKYRKLAHDAHLNGDRVQEETCLQFADHYFRVIADQRQRQEEPRAPRGERWQEGGEPYRDEGEEGGDLGGDGEYQPYERQSYSREERQADNRDERPRYSRDERPSYNRDERDAPPAQEERGEEPAADAAASDSEADPGSVFEPVENPFVRDARGSRGLRPRRDTRSRGNDADAPLGLDPASLPPAISASREAGDGHGEAAEPADEAAPRRRTRRAKPPVDDAGEALEVVG